MTISEPRYPLPAFPLIERPLSAVTDCIVHHSAGAPGQSALSIDAEHRARGFAEIGYHFVVQPDGSVERGRALREVPAAAYGRNYESVDVCLTGDYDATVPTAAAMTSLLELLVQLHHELPISRTIGHRDVATTFYPADTAPYATDCPGGELEALLPELRAKIAARLQA